MLRTLTILALAIGASPATAQTDPVTELVRSRLAVASFELQRIDVPRTLDPSVRVELEYQGQPFELDLRRYNLRTADFRLLVADASGEHEQEAPAPSTFRGEVVGLPGSRVAASFDDGQLHALVTVGDFLQLNVQPLATAMPGARRDMYVVHDVRDVEAVEGVSCGVPDLPAGVTDEDFALEAGSGQRICELGTDSDVQFYIQNGSSVPNTIRDIELMVNRMDDIYDSDVDTRFMISVIIVRTDGSGPYTSSDPSTLLTQFRNHWQSTKGFVKRDVAHLFTGKNLSGGVIGIAYLSAICTSSGYGVSQSRFTGGLVSRTALTAHEVGHNYSAPHCSGGSCTIMCASLGGCGGPLTHFGTTSANRIRNYSFGRPCTPELGSPLAIPFADSFEAASIDLASWPLVQGAVTSTAAMSEPDGTRSVELDAVNSADEAQDRIVSNFMQMAGGSGVAFSYFTQHRGVATGGQLIVEYRDSSLDWNVINTVTSDGSDQTTFQAHSHTLPGDAAHDEFQIRFTTRGGTGSGSDWFLDGVQVGGEPCAAPAPYCVSSPNSFSPSGSFLLSGGSTSLAAGDLLIFAFDAVPGQFGVFFHGPNQIALPFGNGVLCVGGGITRGPLLTTDILGSASYALDGGAFGFTAGDDTNVQFWFRDPAGGGAAFNTSNGLAVTWCP